MVIFTQPAARPANWPAAVPAVRVKMRGVPNLRCYVPGILYASGQPDSVGFCELARQGFRAVVNLRENNQELFAVESLGTGYGWIPIPDRHPPEKRDVRAFLGVLECPSLWPVLVHCKAGEGRANTMAALVRVLWDGWPADRALREARRFRSFAWFPWRGALDGGQDDYVRRVAREGL